MRSLLGTRCAALAVALLASAPASAYQFVGDLVYCDKDANGIFDGTDYKLDGVQVRVTCRDAGGTICFDSTATTGTVHPSVVPATFDSVCSGTASYSMVSGDISGRYAVQILGVNGNPGCDASNPLPFQCTVTVNEATLPSTCDGLVTPVVGLPADANADGDWCDPGDGPFPEGQILGDSSTSQAACEASASPGPSDGVHVTMHNSARSSCSLYADFGYTPRPTGGPTRTPGFWKNHPIATGSLLPISFCGRTVTQTCDAIGLAGQQGGGLNAFTRHAVTAALNCKAFGCSSDVQDVLDAGNAACAAGDTTYDYSGAASFLDEFNNSGDALASGLDQESANPKFCSPSTAKKK